MSNAPCRHLTRRSARRRRQGRAASAAAFALVLLLALPGAPARADDQDEEAINKRHNIYYDDKTGTMAAVNYFKKLPGTPVISVDGSKNIKEVSQLILKELP